MTNIKDLIGKTFTSVTNEDDEELIFENEDGRYSEEVNFKFIPNKPTVH